MYLLFYLIKLILYFISLNFVRFTLNKKKNTYATKIQNKSKYHALLLLDKQLQFSWEAKLCKILSRLVTWIDLEFLFF